MKELSIEEKAQRYDEVLEKARQLCAYPTTKPFISDLQDFFPELKESEDERIRKALIDGFTVMKESKNCGKTFSNHNIPVVDILAWLEKQGEQKLPIEKLPEEMKTIGESLGFTTQEECDEYNKMVSDIIMSADKVEPKFKVKYAGSEYNVFETKDIAGVTFYGIEDEQNHIDYVKAENCEIISGYAIKENGSPYPTKPAVFLEQKPADEDMKEALRTEYEKGRADAFAQMQKEWSEEDKDFMYDTLSNLTELKDRYGEGYGNVGKCIDWLRNLKERYTWKPSDEQMNAFKQVYDWYNTHFAQSLSLNSL